MQPGALAVAGVMLSACAALASDFRIPQGDFAASVLREWPELAEVSTDHERVGILRSWAWCHTDFATVGDPLCIRVNRLVPVETQYARMKANEGGVGIADCAVLLAMLYREFGYDAWHVTGPQQVVVRIEHNGRTLYSVQDPVFNVEVLDRGTQTPLDYFEMLRRLGRREHWSIRVTGPDYATMPRWPRTFVSDDEVAGRKPSDVLRGVWSALDAPSYVEQLREGDLIVHAPRTLEKYLAVKMHDAQGQPTAALQRQVDAGYPPDVLYRHLWCCTAISIYRNDEAMMHRAQSAVALGEGERLEGGR